jgi:hypothetical protein
MVLGAAAETDAGVSVPHWSAQLGSAEYVKVDTLTQSLTRPFAFGLWGLHDESTAVIQETLAGYLAENGWAANTASMGNLMQSELAVSFDWLGVNTASGRFIEIPSVRIRAGLMIAMGGLPDTIRVDPADYSRTWIDLRR